jgi:hypothetical protein
MKPLDYGQVAPPLFLILEKIFATIWPNSEYGLRLFPLLCYITATFLFWKIIAKFLQHNHDKIIAAALFAFSVVIVRYSGEAKQYMTDLLVMLALFWLTVKNYTHEQHRFMVTAAAGSVAIFLSNITPIALLTCGMCHLYRHYNKQKFKNILPTAAVAGAWMGTFLVYYALFVHNHPTRDFMVTYWKDDTFLPRNPLSWDFYVFLFKRAPIKLLASLQDIGFDKPIVTQTTVAILAIFFASGILQLARKKQITTILFICLPISIHLALSGLQLYPFERRLLLYAMPGVAIACAAGFGGLLDLKWHSLEKLKRFTITLAVIVIAATLVSRFPIRRHEYRSCMMFAQKHASETRLIYPYFAIASALVYYKYIGLIQMDAHESSSDFLTNASAWRMLNHDRDKNYVDTVNATLNGQAWILLAGNDEKIIPPLEKLGVTVLEKFEDKGASIYLVEK